MSEPLAEREHPGTTAEPVDPARALTRRNNLGGLVLFFVFLALAGGVVVVALIYNAVADY